MEGLIPILLFLFFIIIPALSKSNAKKKNTPRNSGSNSGGNRRNSSASPSDSFRAQIEAARAEMQRRGINTSRNTSGNSARNDAGRSDMNRGTTGRGSSGIEASSRSGSSASGGMSTRRSREDSRQQAKAALARVLAQRKRSSRKYRGLDDDGDIDPTLTASTRDRLRAGNKGRDDWGTRGDSGLSSGKAFMIYGLLGFLVIFVILRVAPDLLKF